MKKNYFSLLAAIIFAFAFISCDEDEGVNNNTQSEKPKILISTNVGLSSYYGTIKDLSVGSMTNDNSYEHTDKAAAFILGDMVFISEHWMGDKVHKYIRTNNSALQPAGSFTYDAGGKGNCMAFKDATKAYIALNGHGTVYVFNPTTLEHIKTIDLTQYAVGDGNPDPGAMILRNDGKLFVTLCQSITMYTAHDSAYVAVIDSETDEVEKVIIDPRLSGLSAHYNRSEFMDENGDIYFYSAAGFGMMPEANDGYIRIKNGETEFDPDYHFSLKNTTIDGFDGNTVEYGMTFVYAGNGKLYSMMQVPQLTSNPPDYENDKNAQPVEIDIFNKTIKKLDLNPSNMYASVGIAKLGNKILFGMSAKNGDGIYTYDMTTGECSQNPVVTTVGKPQFMNTFDD